MFNRWIVIKYSSFSNHILVWFMFTKNLFYTYLIIIIKWCWKWPNFFFKIYVVKKEREILKVSLGKTPFFNGRTTKFRIPPPLNLTLHFFLPFIFLWKTNDFLLSGSEIKKTFTIILLPNRIFLSFFKINVEE